MMKIRPNIFETNSSSTHSLVCVREESQKEYLKQVFGEQAVEEYDKMFPKDNDWYEPEEVLKALVDLGASWDPKTKELDLTTIDPDTYDMFGYPSQDDIGYKTNPAIKFLLVVAMRDSLSYTRYYYDYDEEDEKSVINKLCDYVGAKKIRIPENLYGINHQCCDEIRDQILDIGIVDTVRRKNIILSIDHD